MSDKVIGNLYADRVMVELAAQEEQTTASGIILPDANNTENKLTHYGTVVQLSDKIKAAVESGLLDEFEKIEVGDTVLFSQFAGSDSFIQGKNYKILRFTDIFGRL